MNGEGLATDERITLIKKDVYEAKSQVALDERGTASRNLSKITIDISSLEIHF